VIDVEGQVVAAALLAGFDQHDAARVVQTLRAQRAKRRHRGEDGVAVVRAAAAVEPGAASHRRPGAESRRPAAHLGLLVEVPVEQHGVVDVAGRFEQQTGARQQATT
jgi:hypothetical protein